MIKYGLLIFCIGILGLIYWIVRLDKMKKWVYDTIPVVFGPLIGCGISLVLIGLIDKIK